MLFIILKIANIFISAGGKRQSTFPVFQTIFEITHVDAAIRIGIRAFTVLFIVFECAYIFVTGQFGIRSPD